MWIRVSGILDLKHHQDGQLQGQGDSRVNKVGVWERVGREMCSADVGLWEASDACMKSHGEQRAWDQTLRLADS